jgi:hypothetical protein
LIPEFTNNKRYKKQILKIVTRDTFNILSLYQLIKV